MNNEILADHTVVYYVVKVNGNTVSNPVSSSMLAEMDKQKLPVETQAIAEVVPVTADGKQLLLG